MAYYIPKPSAKKSKVSYTPTSAKSYSPISARSTASYGDSASRYATSGSGGGGGESKALQSIKQNNPKLYEQIINSQSPYAPIGSDARNIGLLQDYINQNNTYVSKMNGVPITADMLRNIYNQYSGQSISNTPITGGNVLGYDINSLLGDQSGQGGFDINSLLGQLQQYPEPANYDPMAEAQKYMEWMRQQRISAVNKAIDEYVSQLSTEKGRVGPYYEKLLGELGITRSAALEGSESTLMGVNREYTRNRLSLTDLKDQMTQQTTSNLSERGVLNSGVADAAYRNIDKVISSAISSAMKDKDVKVSDVLEGKENVQEAYTAAIKGAKEEQAEYLRSIEGAITGAEKQRGQETLNIENELAAYLPVLSRQLATDKWNQQMQYAQAGNNQLLNQYNLAASMNKTGTSPSWYEQAMMQFRYDQMAQQMAIAGMNNQSQPNYGGLWNELSSGYQDPEYLQHLMMGNQSGLLSQALGIDQNILSSILGGYAAQSNANLINQYGNKWYQDNSLQGAINWAMQNYPNQWIQGIPQSAYSGLTGW